MAKQQADSSTGGNASQDEVAAYEQELAGYLQERIRPGLNRGAIPLLARSIAKEIAHREHPNGTPQDAEADEEPTAEAEADDEQSAEVDDEPSAGVEDEAEDEQAAEADDEDEPRAEAEDEDEPSAEADEDEPSEEGDEAAAFEDEMHELQADLGDEWILRFSVQGDEAWLTAEKDDGSQRVEAPTAAVLIEAVELLNESGGRST